MIDVKADAPILLTIRKGFRYHPHQRPDLSTIKIAIKNWKKSNKTFIPPKFLAKAVNFQEEFEYQNLGR